MNPTHVQRYIEAFEQPDALDMLQSLEDCFAEQAHFVDPFNDVRGSRSIRRVFEHMFASCEDPRFEVDECLGDDTGLSALAFQFRQPGLAAQRARRQPGAVLTRRPGHRAPRLLGPGKPAVRRPSRLGTPVPRAAQSPRGTADSDPDTNPIFSHLRGTRHDRSTQKTRAAPTASAPWHA